VFIYHISFIDSSISRCLGCVHLFTIVNSAVMNVGVQIFFKTLNFFEYIPQSVIAGSYDSSISKFSRNIHTVFAPLYNPTNSAHTFTNICHFLLFWKHNHPSGCAVIPHGFDLHFSSDVGHFFMFVGHL